MGNNTWENALDPFPTARGTAKNTFTAAVDFSPGPLPVSYANELKLGTKVELEAYGEFSTTGTPTLALGFYYGSVLGGAVGTAIAVSGTITTGSGAAAWPWHMKWCGLITAVGATGVLYGSGVLDLGTSLIAFAASAFPVTAAARSVGSFDTTLTKTWGVGATFGTSSASNQVICDLLTAKITNQGKTS